MCLLDYSIFQCFKCSCVYQEFLNGIREGVEIQYMILYYFFKVFIIGYLIDL